MTDTATPIDEYTLLEQAIREGDTTVTAAQLAKAKAAADHAELVAAGAEHLAEQERLAQLETDRETWRNEHATNRAEVIETGRTAYAQLIAAYQGIATAVDRYNTLIRTATARARTLGIGDELDDPRLDANRILTQAWDDARGRNQPSRIRIGGELKVGRIRRTVFTPPAWADTLDAERTNRP